MILRRKELRAANGGITVARGKIAHAVDTSGICACQRSGDTRRRRRTVTRRRV